MSQWFLWLCGSYTKVFTVCRCDSLFFESLEGIFPGDPTNSLNLTICRDEYVYNFV